LARRKRFFSPARRAKAALSLDNTDAVIDAASARLTHYESAGFALGGPVQGTTPATASWNSCAVRTPIRRDYTKSLTNSDPERDGAAP